MTASRAPTLMRRDMVALLSRGGGGLRSTLARCAVFVRCGEHAAAVSKGHAPARRIVRSVACAEALDDDHVAFLHGVAADTPALEHARRSGREAPVRHLALLVLHVDVEPAVRVGPLDPRDDASDF